MSALDIVRLSSPALQRANMRQFLSEKDEQEALNVLREKFRHEKRITSDDVRYVVRAIASQGGATNMPSDFPPMCWIFEFKRAHGFTPHGGRFIFGLPERLNCRGSSSIAHVAASTASSGGSSDDERDESNPTSNLYDTTNSPDASARFSLRSKYDSDSQMQRARRQQHQRRSLVVDDHRTGNSWKHCEQTWGREELSSNATSGSGDSENGATTGDSSNSSAGASAASSIISTDCRKDECVSPKDSATSSPKRGYKMSHTVPPETWEKAIAAVEQQGMSLRAAARIYGVHFAALHRRVKKRAQEGQSSKGANGYFHQSDEAGIMRVVVARAELGVLMTFDELMKLVEAAALRKLPDISVENARKLMVRFQSRNEQSIRHLIVDWPPPVPALMSGSTANHYHLEHPGYTYRSERSSRTSLQQPLRAQASGGLATATVVAPTSSHLLSPSSSINGNRPMLPSLDVNMNSLRASVSQQHQHQDARDHSAMLV